MKRLLANKCNSIMYEQIKHTEPFANIYTIKSSSESYTTKNYDGKSDLGWEMIYTCNRMGPTVQ